MTINIGLSEPSCRVFNQLCAKKKTCCNHQSSSDLGLESTEISHRLTWMQSQRLTQQPNVPKSYPVMLFVQAPYPCIRLKTNSHDMIEDRYLQLVQVMVDLSLPRPEISRSEDSRLLQIQCNRRRRSWDRTKSGELETRLTASLNKSKTFAESLAIRQAMWEWSWCCMSKGRKYQPDINQL